MTAIPDSAAPPERRELQYVYQDGDGFVFLDPDSDAVVTLPHERAIARQFFLKEGERVHVLFDAGRPLTLEPPTVVELAVTDTEPPRASVAAPKPALLETGLRIMVPASIAIGETVVVDTRSGAFLRRAGRGR